MSSTLLLAPVFVSTAWLIETYRERRRFATYSDTPSVVCVKEEKNGEKSSLLSTHNLVVLFAFAISTAFSWHGISLANFTLSLSLPLYIAIFSSFCLLFSLSFVSFRCCVRCHCSCCLEPLPTTATEKQIQTQHRSLVL